jgi:glycosyltransferase involved in cell wall biosynthesis
MNVIYLTQVFETGQDPGSERHFYFCRYLARHDHTVTAITSNVDYKRATVKYPGEGWCVRRQIDGVSICYVYSYASFRGSFKKRFWYYLTYLFAAVLAGLFVRKPDVVYAVSTPLTVGLLGYLLSCLRGVSFVFEVTDVWPDAAVAVGVVRNQAFIRAAHWLEMFCYRKAARIVALTEGIRDNIVGKGVPAEKVLLITNGVDTSLFQVRPAGDDNRMRLRRELRFDGRFVCMYLGAHGAYNALGTIIDAAEALSSDPRYLCVLVGDGDEKPRLQAMVHQRGLANVRFLPPIPRKDTPPLLQAADAFLLPNRRGEFYAMNLPNKLFDFLASGRPIVVAGHGESAELVQSARAGYVVPAEEGAAMAEAIKRLTALGCAERATMGQSGRRYVLENYDRNKLSRTFLDVLERVVRSTGGDKG